MCILTCFKFLGRHFLYLPPQVSRWGGNCRPCQIGVAAYGSPKGTSLRQNTRFELSTMKIELFFRAVRESTKKMKKGPQRYISRICGGGGTPKDGELKLGTFVEPMNIINRTNFHLFLMNSFRASGGSNMRIYP
jgi:hypothetical protein